MRTPGSSANAASVVVIGTDARAMGQVRETLGTEAVLPAAAIAYEDGLTAVRKVRPDVVITGFDLDYEEAIRLAPMVLHEHPRTHLVALAVRADPERIRAAMRAGYREFVVLPEDAELLRQAVHEAVYDEARDEDNGDVIALWGSKGGVGTTFLACNMGAELSPVHRVCVVDLDYAMGDVASFLDVQANNTIADVFRNVNRLDERMLSGHVVVHASKLHALVQPTELDQREEPRGDLVMRVLTAVARSYQYTLVDCGGSLDEASVTAATVADHLLLVCTPDIPAVKNTFRRLKFVEQLGVDRKHVHLVVNRWDKKSAYLSVADIESSLGRKVDVLIPEDRTAFKAVNEGRLVRDLDRRAPAARAIEAMVGLITEGEVEATKKQDGFMSRLFGL
jgi:pilus assembly protein CpaE